MAFKMEKPVMFSEDGYKRYSSDVNNKQNLIPTGDITMKDVDFPVHGVDNEGNEKIMEPGKDYKFPGDVVLETPLNKNKNQMAFQMKNMAYWKAKNNHAGVGSPLNQQKPGYKKPEGSGTEKGQHTTHGDPETYTKYVSASGKPVDSAKIDEGNLSKVQVDDKGRNFVVVQDDTDNHDAGTKLYINNK